MATTMVRASKASDVKKAPMPILIAQTLAVMDETDEIIRAHQFRFSTEADLRKTIQNGIDSGPGIPSDQVFAELKARYADPVLTDNSCD